MPVNIGVNIQRSPNRINQQLREAGVEGKFPKLLLDFKDQYYLASGGSKTLANAVTHARSGNATMTDSYGPELIDNPSFSDTSFWTTTATSPATSTIANGVATIVSPAGEGATCQADILTVGKVYEVTVKVKVRSGSCKVQLGSSATANGTKFFSSSGTYTFVRENDGTDGLLFLARSGACDVDFDDISVREIPVLKWAPHNLCRNSEDATASNFFKSNVTVTSVSSVTAPNGTTGVNKYEFAGAAGDNVYITDGGADIRGGVTGTFAVFAKAVSSATTIRMRIWDNGTTGAQYVDKSVSADDWTLLTHEATTSSNSTTANFAIYNNSSGNASDIYVWGFHIFRSDLGGMVDNPDRGDSYVPTTSSAKYLPRIGHHVYNGSAWVNEGLLAESEARTNLVTQNNEFDGTDWGTARLTITADSAVSPDGTQNAYKLAQASGQTTAGYVDQNINSTSGNNYTASVYAKAGTNRDHIVFVETLADGGGNYSYVDLTTGLAGTVATDHTVLTQDVGNGWYRVIVQFDCTSSQTGAVYSWRPIETDGSLSVTDDQGFIYVYGAMLEVGSTPSSLIPTDSATVTRAAETFTIPSANLPWPSPNYIGSELVTNGTFDTDVSGWGHSNVSGTSTFSVTSGEATFTRDTFGDSFYQTDVAPAVAGVYLLTFDITAISGGGLRYSFSPNTAANTANRVTATTVGTHSTAFVSDGTLLDFVFDLDTNGASVTIDNVTVREIDPLSVSIAMDGRMTYADENAFGTATFFRWYDTSSDYILIGNDTDSTDTGEINFRQIASGTQQITNLDAYSPDVFVPFNVAMRNGSTFVGGAVDGVAATANTAVVELPDLSATDLELAQDYMGTIGTFRVWDRDIGDTGLVEATNPSLEPSLSLTFEGTGTNSFIVNDWSE